ncbi:SH3 domain-containing protein [Thermoflexus sp.]|uniref:SH3 domain-containing protein n=2 Tax=Thermoflexus sp. TaxID=1969742 RepID=UPI0025FA07E1|nr:SH3 domain-containing protein [Thermoflexus sp.]MDW8064067.1 SH3 domain-containing protein [Anaerolineae bacterium]MCS6964490.1 SH3 domain-containing protein [Thermoflexus sp.]MCS7349965.1 SH3 domain-containing protein [Thermoflexus sp.]MCX7690185.1 SH3 domain-containing protein [Thermoflexus sp.]MDW8179413.1 SH3 domain-containing protein [Anaerolineae bacterium]
MNRKAKIAICSVGITLWLVACQTGGPPTPPVLTPTASPLPPQQAPTPTATPTARAPQGPFAVVLVPPADQLHVRAGPGADQPILATLPPNASGLFLTGKEQTVQGARWVEVRLPDGRIGWVNAMFLTQEVPLQTFCADPQVSALLDRLEAAIRERNGPALAALISPIHGLRIHVSRLSDPVLIRPEQAATLFTDETPVHWGVHPASAMEIIGSFRQAVLPDLLDVIERPHERHCGLLVPPVTYQPTWPEAYQAFPFYSLHRPGTPGNELDWRTWVVGVAYVDGRPYVAVLMQFFWEP